MHISDTTISNLLKAVETIGEKEVNNILETLSKRDLIIIDKIVELCCVELDINRSFLKIKNNRTKTDLLSTIVYVLRKNGIGPGKILDYFSDYTIRIKDMYEYILNLSEMIPDEFRLKVKVIRIEAEAKHIFEKYFINNNEYHGTEKAIQRAR
jgi:hypothetical protein